MSVDDSQVVKAPVIPGSRVRFPLVGDVLPPIGAEHWPCYPVRFNEIQESDLIVNGGNVCDVTWLNDLYMHVVVSRLYRSYEDLYLKRPAYRTMYTLHRDLQPYVWKYDLSEDLSV